MASAEYYRKQADLCRRLAESVTGEVSQRILLMAEEYRAKAEEAEAEERNRQQRPAGDSTEAG